MSLAVLFLFLVGSGDLGRLARVPGDGYLFFALSGLIHFFGGWTLLNQSQKLLGAALVVAGALILIIPRVGGQT